MITVAHPPQWLYHFIFPLATNECSYHTPLHIQCGSCSGLCILAYVCGTWSMSLMPTSGILSQQQQRHSGVCEFLWSLSFAFLILSQVLRLRNEPIMLNTSGKWRLLLLLAFKGPKGLKERSFVLCSGNSPLVPSANKNKACVPRATHHQALFVLEAGENPSLVRH